MKYLGLFAFVLLLTACSAPSTQTDATSTLIGNQAAQAEIARLGPLTDAGKVSEQDFATLTDMVKDDEYASDETGEITTMVHYGEYKHAAHGLSFLDSYVQTGQVPVCPGHALSHYYVFSRHGEDERAQDALGEAKEQLPEWEEKAQAYMSQYPGKDDFNMTLSRITGHISDIEAGNTTTSEDEVDALSNIICVT